MELERLAPEQLSGDQKELAEVIGWDAYRKLLAHYAGCTIYVKKPERIAKPDRDAEICQEFNGSNYRQLARTYRLSENTIRNIISQNKNKRNN